MTTPDEIKRDMIDYMEDASCVVEYGDAHDLIDSVEKGHATMADALAHIQQLERDNAQKDERIRQLEREREALLEESKHGGGCFTCKHKNTLMNEPPCDDCWRCNRWEWRGVEGGRLNDRDG